jgi:hypothetical protein
MKMISTHRKIHKKVRHLIMILFVSLFVNMSLLNVSVYAEAKGVANSNKVTAKVLRSDLPDYVFESDLQDLYPATWEFYKKLDILNRDKVYSYYLYNPGIEKVRHKIFALALGKGKGKTKPEPFSLAQVIEQQDKQKKTPRGLLKSAPTTSVLSMLSIQPGTTQPKTLLSRASGTFLIGGSHSLVNSPAIGTIKLTSDF